ncbi:glycosyltransferase, partial [Myxococcota bacterium]|nr:glycosyltransferase [Myxococcota bacterium]
LKRLRELFQEHPPSTLVFMNLNPLVDRLTIRIARKANPAVRVVSFLHEPHTTQKLVYGFKRASLLYVYEFFSRGMARLSDAVILPSENAGEVFDRFFSGFRGDARIIPLPYADERCDEEFERRYVSFVGHIGNAYQKGFDLFLEMVEENAKRSGKLVFQLVTGENPENALSALSPSARESLSVVHQDRLTDQKISQAVRQSLAVVLLQRRVMQSGVLPVAFMNGTPVIASDLEGFTEFVDEGKTGCILPVDPTLEQRFEAIERIREKIDEMAPLSRRAYEERFGRTRVAPHVPFILGLSDPPQV